MFRIQTILFPTDFSDSSEHAFTLACTLAREHRARLIVVHVVPPFIATEGYVPPPSPTHSEEVWAEFRQLQDADPRVRELRVESKIAEGDPAREILRLARDTRADLIVMGTHGRTGLRRLLVGSVAEQVLRGARALC